MLTHSTTTTGRLILMVIVIWWDILHGQTVPSGVGEGGAVPIRISRLFDADSAQALNSTLDTLDMHLLQIEIAKAEASVSETSFWMRIIPQVHISASYGMHDIMFVDPTTFSPYFIPKDAYRLSLTMSINDIFNSSKNVQASLDLQRLRTEEIVLKEKQRTAQRRLDQELKELQNEEAFLQVESTHIRELVRFNELRFKEGKIEFDALTRTRLELLGEIRAIERIHSRESLLKLGIFN
jgi:hypothetical protein